MSGAGFFELRILFNSQYEQLNQISNEITERVRMLSGVAIGSLLKFINFTGLDKQSGKGSKIMGLLADHEAVIRSLREYPRKCIEDYEDEGSFEMLVSIIRLHEKMAWMMRFYLEPELSHEEKTVG